ncbi:glycosyltransferase family 2 protein [Desulfatirhabdium butyrativorans]|uniref:glycosyltransferase family 2 protein n=1 Tax=Desulfatirhabdium butyrativorans TaxID=340467 RepID=UPI000406DC7E|nr:glycosyltransferase family 2 protein [Desulfatirhabdium butyrativorans]
MKGIFWFCLLSMLYTLIGYPCWLWMLARVAPRPIRKGKHTEAEALPTISIILAARNEGERIENRIRNLLEQRYPVEKMQLILIDDGSGDETALKIRSCFDTLPKNLPKMFLSHHPSKGKPWCINSAAEGATGEILVFCDARQRFGADALQEMVLNFSDPAVGCVSGELVFETTAGSDIQVEMGSYWKFETWIRGLESRTGSVAGATGAIYALRKSLFRPIPQETILDDVLIPLRAGLAGYRIVFEHGARAYDVVSKDMEQERRRKIRTLAGNWQLLFLEPALAHPRKNPLWFRFMSHKILRLIVPYWAICMVIAAMAIRDAFSIAVLALFFASVLLALAPPQKLSGAGLGKPARICRAVIFLYAFAAIAPLRLLFSPRSLWSR